MSAGAGDHAARGAQVEAGAIHVASLRPEHLALGTELAARLIGDFAVGRAGGCVVGVAGESGSGKSITAVGLARGLEAMGLLTVVLHQDDYFLRPPRTNHEHRLADLAHVGPHEVNLALLAAHVAAFRRGAESVDAPAVDYPGNRFLTRRVALRGVDVLVVEGTYALMLPDLDVRVFLEATYDDTRARRRARARDEDTPFVERVLAIEHDVIARQAAAADVLIDRAFALRRR